MEKDSSILKWIHDSEKRNLWFVILFTKPQLYLRSLIKRTIAMGLFLFFIYEFLKKINFNHEAIPPTFHSIVGIVIGLLLVFRTNTAYDRWWEARKIFASIHSSFLIIGVGVTEAGKDKITKQLKIINGLIIDFLSESEFEKSEKIRNAFLQEYISLYNLVKKENLSGNIEKKTMELMDSFCSLERIKDTPIPTSYSLHIKFSVFAYLSILPFSLFFGMGIWAIPLVMILFFIIAGIEIISNEIENPFHGDPNDLPIEDFKLENEKYINGTR